MDVVKKNWLLVVYVNFYNCFYEVLQNCYHLVILYFFVVLTMLFDCCFYLWSFWKIVFSNLLKNVLNNSNRCLSTASKYCC